MTPSEELVEAVRARLAGTPYRLEVTERGFDVGVDLADASWWALMQRRHLEKTFTHRVVLDEAAKELAITDDSWELTWHAGADVGGGVPRPVLGGRISRSLGRLESRSFQRTYAVRDDGSFGKVVDYSFDSSESRRLVREPATELGWTERRGTAERVGIGFALLGAGGAVLTLVVLALVLLLR